MGFWDDVARESSISSGSGRNLPYVVMQVTLKEKFLDEEDDWTVVTEDELPSAQWEHTFVMTENGLEILTY